MIRWLIAFFPAMTWAGVVVWAGMIEGVPGAGVPGLDKLAHFLLYSVLGWLLGRGAHRVGATGPWLPVLLLGLGLALGAAQELHQLGLAGRTGDGLDWVADAVGLFAGWAAYRLGTDSMMGRKTGLEK